MIGWLIYAVAAWGWWHSRHILDTTADGWLVCLVVFAWLAGAAVKHAAADVERGTSPAWVRNLWVFVHGGALVAVVIVSVVALRI